MTSSSKLFPRLTLGHAVFALASLCALAISPAQAQNIDQGKTAPQLYAATCAACHKNPGVLAKGRSGWGLSSFLKEHYTASSNQASALADYLASVDAGPARQKAPKRAKRPPPSAPQ
jgi:mono/diheme cytochrome c family protein